MATNPTGPNAAPQGQNKMKILVIVLAVVVAVLAGILIYQLSQNNQLTEQVTDLGDRNQDLIAEIDEMNTKVNRLEMELQQSNLDGEQKQQRIEQMLRQIQDLQGRANEAIRQQRLSAEQLTALQGRMEELTFLNAKYEREIAALKAANEQLTSQNEELSSNVQNLTTEGNNLRTEVRQSQQQIERLNNPLTVSSLTYTVGDGGRDQQGPIFRKGKMKGKLKVCLSVNANTIAETGERDVYLVIMGPNGQVIQSLETSSGRFTAGGQERIYTAKARINFTGQRMNTCIEYMIPDRYEFEKGPYTVEVFIDGQRAGSDSFMVKTVL